MSTITVSHTLKRADLEDLDKHAEERGFTREKAFAELFEVVRRAGKTPAAHVEKVDKVEAPAKKG